MSTNKSLKVKYISDIHSVFFKKGNVYEAVVPKDDKSGRFYAFYLEDMDEPGYYALPASRFEESEMMIRYELVNKDGFIYEYRYYPDDGDTFGTVVFDSKDKKVIRYELAENDDDKYFYGHILSKLMKFQKSGVFEESGIMAWC